MRAHYLKPKFIARILFIFALALPLKPAQASFSLRFDLESRIQEKVRSLVTPFDPYSQVMVTVHVKELSVELPGVGTSAVHMESNTSPTALSLDDIDSIDVSVITQLDPLPESLKKLIESAIDIPVQKKHLEFKKMPEDTMKLIPVVAPAANHLAAFTDGLFKRLNWLFAFSAFGLCVLVFGMFFRRKGFKSQTEALKNIADGMKELSTSGIGSSSGAGSAPQSSPVSSPIHSNELSANDRDWIQALGIDGLTALLSDCYWCEEDGYAAWVWKQIRPDLAQEVFKKWPRAREYFGALSGTHELASNYHHHPYYLKPLPLEDVSSDDLQTWVKHHPSIWPELSPLRQAKFSLTLMERLALNEKQSALIADILPELPKASIKTRVLHRPFSVGKLSEQDEMAIFENPASVPVSLRSQIQSLVWVAILPESSRRELVSKIQAQGLAEIWVGPEAVLNLISEVLPEKKRTLVFEYRKKHNPSASSARASTWMSYVVQEALLILETQTQVIDSAPLASVTSITSSAPSDSDAA